jgi:hypothetical protein
MNKSCLFLIATLALSHLVSAEQDVRFTTNCPWAYTPFAEGIVSRTRTGVSLSLHRVQLTFTSKVEVSPIKILRYRFGVVLEGAESGTWRASHWSVYAPVNAYIAPGGILEMKNVAVSIPINSQLSLKGRWLVVQVEGEARSGRRGYTVAHSGPIVTGDALPAVNANARCERA